MKNSRDGAFAKRDQFLPIHLGVFWALVPSGDRGSSGKKALQNRLFRLETKFRSSKGCEFNYFRSVCDENLTEGRARRYDDV